MQLNYEDKDESYEREMSAGSKRFFGVSRRNNNIDIENRNRNRGRFNNRGNSRDGFGSRISNSSNRYDAW